MISDEEIKLSFLLSGSCDLPPSCIKLRSYLNTHLASVADRCNVKLLKSFRNRNKTCPNCYSSWSAETTSFKLLPTKKFAIQQSKSDENVKEIRNTLVLKCRVCTKKSLFSLIKRRLVKEKIVKEECVKKKSKPNSVVKSNKMDYQSPGMLVKKKKRNAEQANIQQKVQNIPQNGSKGKKRQSSGNGAKKLVPNPFAVQTQNRCSKKRDRKFERLKQAIKQDQGSAKKTLQDFLSLV